MAGQHLEPELLANGDILAPITESNGAQKLVRLEPGEEEHAAWLGYIQRQRSGRGAVATNPTTPGWYYDPFSDEGRERWFDGKNWHPQWRDATTPPPPVPPTWAPAPRAAPRSGHPWRTIAAVAAAILVLLWFGGALDEPLSHVGLNKNACIKNAFGATFCGDDAKNYCSNLSALRKFAGGHTACDDIEQP